MFYKETNLLVKSQNLCLYLKILCLENFKICIIQKNQFFDMLLYMISYDSYDFVRRTKLSQTYHPRGLFLFIENSIGLESIPWGYLFGKCSQKRDVLRYFQGFLWNLHI